MAASLRPKKGIVRYLLVSPTTFVGEAEVPGRLLLTHAFPFNDLTHQFADPRRSVSPLTRCFFVLSFPVHRGHNDDTHATKLIASLSVFFGKRFVNLGPIEKDAAHGLPSFPEFQVPPIFRAGCWNNAPRTDCEYGKDRSAGYPLCFKDFEQFARAMLRARQGATWHCFHRAAASYHDALTTCTTNLCKAYLDLVMVLELLAEGMSFPKQMLYSHDAELTKLFEEMRQHGLRHQVRFVQKRLYQVKRRVHLTTRRLMIPSFFRRLEATQPGLRLELGDFDTYISTAYDLRSQYVHAGLDFTETAKGTLQRMAEVSPAPFGKSSRQSPTFVGLERMVRFMLLRFIKDKAGLDHPDLLGPGMDGIEL